MAKVSLKIEFENPEWKPISIETETTDKNAYRIYRTIIPRPMIVKEVEHSE